jgi:hypothetical protein
MAVCVGRVRSIGVSSTGTWSGRTSMRVQARLASHAYFVLQDAGGRQGASAPTSSTSTFRWQREPIVSYTEYKIYKTNLLFCTQLTRRRRRRRRHTVDD